MSYHLCREKVETSISSLFIDLFPLSAERCMCRIFIPLSQKTTARAEPRAAPVVGRCRVGVGALAVAHTRTVRLIC